MSKKGDSIQIARAYLDKLVLEGRLFGAIKPSSKVTVLGREFETPIMTAALSHLKGGMKGFADGARQAGAICSIGMGDNETMADAISSGASVLKVIKPYEDDAQIYSRIRFAEENGAFALGMDIEHAINNNEDTVMVLGEDVLKVPSFEEMKAYVASTRLPFFFKGAMSVQDAMMAKKAGAAGIILSHHNSIAMWSIPPYAMLAEIRKAVGDDFILISDGGIEDGYDAFKVLALGADLVTVGRPLMGAYNTEGTEGVRKVLEKMTAELRSAMWHTGAKDVESIDRSAVHEAWWL